MGKIKSWGMFAQNNHTGEILGWVGTHGLPRKCPTTVRSVLDDKCVMGIKNYSKAIQSFGVLKRICRDGEPGVYTLFMVRLSKNTNSYGLKCKHIADVVKANGKSILVKYEFSYEA